MRRLLISSSLLLLTACGVGTPSSTRSVSSSEALTGVAEWLEFEPVARRAELMREVVRQSQAESGQAGAVLFPMLLQGEYVAARGLDRAIDLLQAPDAGAGLLLSFESRADPFGEERRDAWQGLSEREATELVVRSLLHHWAIETPRTIVVTRAAGAPYAAAYMDGVLRINPAFVYLAAAPAAP